MQNAGGVLGSVLAPIYGHLLELRLRLQLGHEIVLHRFHSHYHLCYEIQEAILFGKSVN